MSLGHSLSDSVDSRVCGTVRLTRAAQLLLSSPCVAVGDLPTFSVSAVQLVLADSGLRTRTPPIRVANLFSVQFSSILVPYMGASIFHVMCVCKKNGYTLHTTQSQGHEDHGHESKKHMLNTWRCAARAPQPLSSGWVHVIAALDRCIRTRSYTLSLRPIVLSPFLFTDTISHCTHYTPDYALTKF